VSTITYSIIVSTRNRAGALARLLPLLMGQQTDKPYEVIVVDNQSTDTTRAVVQPFLKHPAFRYVVESNVGMSHARNRGIVESRGDILVFVDDDAIIDSEWMQTLTQVYRQDPDAWVVGGKIVLEYDGPLPRWYYDVGAPWWLVGPALDYGDDTILLAPGQGLWGASLSARRDTITRIGGFRTDLGYKGKQRIGGEDNEFCGRVQAHGGRVYYCGAAVVRHPIPRARYTVRAIRRAAYWKGRTIACAVPPERALPVLRSLIRGAVNYSLGRTAMGFRHELEFWQYLGYWHERVLCRLGLRRAEDPVRALERARLCKVAGLNTALSTGPGREASA